MKRILSAIITISMILACMVGSLVLFTGCKPDIEIDNTRTQLYIGVKDDGIGKDWVYDAIEKFEADEYWSNWENPNDSSRKGIQVIPKFEDSLYEQKNVETSMPSAKESVYVLSSINFFQWLNSDNTSGMLVNLWDTVNEDPDGEGPERSIYDRMSQIAKDHLTVTLANGEKAIYTLPYHENYWGAIYDADIFEDFDLYNLDDYVGLDGEEGTEDDCWGPNGVEDDVDSHTCDDGLPATWEDMKVLIRTMADVGVIPFTWNQNTYTYQTGWLKSIMAAYEGKENYELRYSMNGTHTKLGAIDKTNAYKLADAEGIRAALTVAEFIRSNADYYSVKADYSSQSHLAAQEEFIMSTKDKPIGFLLESGWWENEAKGTFASMANTYGEEYGYGKRNFKWLPFPKFIGTNGIDDQENMKTTMYSGVGTGGGGWMLSANVEDVIKPVALGFIEFCNSEKMMGRFTEVTGICRPYEYELSDEQIDNMTSYTRTIYEYRKLGQTPGSNVELIRYSTRNPFVVNVSSYFGVDYEFDALLYKGQNNQRSANNPLTAFKDDASLTVDDYIEGIKAQYNKDTWESKLGDLYDEYDSWLAKQTA